MLAIPKSVNEHSGAYSWLFSFGRKPPSSLRDTFLPLTQMLLADRFKPAHRKAVEMLDERVARHASNVVRDGDTSCGQRPTAWRRGPLTVLGIEVAGDPQAVQDRVGYMPQKFGLYEDLTVQENLDLYADLHGVTGGGRAASAIRS